MECLWRLCNVCAFIFYSSVDNCQRKLNSALINHTMEELPRELLLVLFTCLNREIYSYGIDGDIVSLGSFIEPDIYNLLVRTHRLFKTPNMEAVLIRTFEASVGLSARTQLPNGALHSVNDQPAVVSESRNTRRWYRYGLRHRDDGPAVIWPDGSCFWYTNDVCTGSIAGE